MQVVITVSKDGKEIVSETIENPGEGDIGAAIQGVYKKARDIIKGPIWDTDISIRSKQ